MTDPTMTTTRDMGACPACGKPLTARVQMSVELGAPVDLAHVEGDESTIPATVRLVGLELSHNCIPKVTR